MQPLWLSLSTAARSGFSCLDLSFDWSGVLTLETHGLAFLGCPGALHDFYEGCAVLEWQG